LLYIGCIDIKDKDEEWQATRGGYVVAEKHLSNLHYLWTQAKFSFMPNIHGLLSHAALQMRHFLGIGDTLEDDVERIHQISAQIESCVSRMKNRGQQAHVRIVFYLWCGRRPAAKPSVISLDLLTVRKGTRE